MFFTRNGFFRLYARYVRWVVQAVHRNIYTRRYRCRDGIRALAARLEGVILLDDVRRILAEEFVRYCLNVGFD